MHKLAEKSTNNLDTQVKCKEGKNASKAKVMFEEKRSKIKEA